MVDQLYEEWFDNLLLKLNEGNVVSRSLKNILTSNNNRTKLIQQVKKDIETEYEALTEDGKGNKKISDKLLFLGHFNSYSNYIEGKIDSINKGLFVKWLLKDSLKNITPDPSKVSLPTLKDRVFGLTNEHNFSFEYSVTRKYNTPYVLKPDIPIIPCYTLKIKSKVFPLFTGHQDRSLNVVQNNLNTYDLNISRPFTSLRYRSALREKTSTYYIRNKEKKKYSFITCEDLSIYGYDGKKDKNTFLFTFGIDKEYFKDVEVIKKEEYLEIIKNQLAEYTQSICTFLQIPHLINHVIYDLQYNCRDELKAHINNMFKFRYQDKLAEKLIDYLNSNDLIHLMIWLLGKGNTISRSDANVFSVNALLKTRWKYIYPIFDTEILNFSSKVVRLYFDKFVEDWEVFKKKYTNLNDVRLMPNMQDYFFNRVDVSKRFGSDVFEIKKEGEKVFPFLKN